MGGADGGKQQWVHRALVLWSAGEDAAAAPHSHLQPIDNKCPLTPAGKRARGWRLLNIFKGAGVDIQMAVRKKNKQTLLSVQTAESWIMM